MSEEALLLSLLRDFRLSQYVKERASRTQSESLLSDFAEAKPFFERQLKEHVERAKSVNSFTGSFERSAFRGKASKIEQAEYRAKLCLSFVEAPPIFEAKPQRTPEPQIRMAASIQFRNFCIISLL